jgi:hypothetical protein
MSGRIEEIGEICRAIQTRMDKVDGLSFEIEAIARFVQAEEDKQRFAEFKEESGKGSES